MQDFPAEIFLQRPKIVQARIHIKFKVFIGISFAEDELMQMIKFLFTQSS